MPTFEALKGRADALYIVSDPALGFATLSMPSYDRALHALRTWLDVAGGSPR